MSVVEAQDRVPSQVLGLVVNCPAGLLDSGEQQP